MKIKLVAKNAGASIVTQIINIITNFILPPLIISTYGSQINGLVATIKQLMSYISLVGAGISVATTHSLYKPLAEKNYMKTSGMVNAANKMFNKAGIYFTALSLLTAFTYPFLIKGSLDYYLVFLLIVIMSIEGATEFFVVGKCRTLLYADHKSYVTSFVQASGLIVSFILAYILIKQNLNIVLVQLSIASVYIIKMIVLSAYLKRNYSYLDAKIPPIETAIKKRNDAFIHQLTGLAILSSQMIILTTFIGLEAASIYAVYNVVFSGFYSICSHMISAVAPFLGKSYAMNLKSNLKVEFNKIEFVYNTLLSVIYPVCTIMLIPFISIYVGQISDVNYIDYKVAALFILVSFFNTIRLPAQSVINVAGHFKETKKRAIIEAIICIILQLVFVNFYGIYGVLIGTAIALGWRCFDIINYTNKFIISQKSTKSILRIIKIPLITFILLLLNINYLKVEATNYLDWIQWGVIFSLISVLLIIVINIIFERKEFIDILKFGKKVFLNRLTKK